MAITYYIVGLIGYALTALNAAGFAFDMAWVRGLSIPAVAVAVWFGVRWLRRTVMGARSEGG